MSDPWQPQRRFVYLLVIAVAGACALSNIATTTLLYSPAKPWPKNPLAPTIRSSCMAELEWAKHI